MKAFTSELIGYDFPILVEIVWVRNQEDWSNPKVEAEHFLCKPSLIMLEDLKYLDMNVCMFALTESNTEHKNRMRFLKIMLYGADYDVFEPRILYTEHDKSYRTISLNFHKTGIKTCGGCKCRRYGVCTNKEARLYDIKVFDDQKPCTSWINANTKPDSVSIIQDINEVVNEESHKKDN
jgi:hypothetical protein